MAAQVIAWGQRCLSWLRQKIILVLALLAAVISMFWVTPSAAYAAYLDLRVLCLLFCLMVVVAGWQRCGLLGVLAQRLLAGRKSLRLLCLVLVMLPFFSSMLVTNDVALITFVPFTILVLRLCGQQRYLIYVIVLQTMAANLGSMATPVGNPQNLFLCSHFQISFLPFLGVMLPLTLISCLALALATLCVGKETIEVHFEKQERIHNPRQLLICAGLFLLCLLAVFHLLPYGLVLAAVLGVFLLEDRQLLRCVDYGLLLTFVCFFIFAGNLGRIEGVQQFLWRFMADEPAATSILASQMISNVPASIFLADFTRDWRGLLVGVNIGGLGTLIASLASLISFQYYVRCHNARPWLYVAVFTLANGAGLLLLSGVAYLGDAI